MSRISLSSGTGVNVNITPSAPRPITIQRQGTQGLANRLSIGSVSVGDEASASVTGEPPNQTLDLVFERAEKGEAATISVGTVTTLAPHETAFVINRGDENSAVLDFGIPAGADGEDGNDGVVQSIIAGQNVTVDSSDPAHPVINATGSAGGRVDQVIEGNGVSVDATDPAAPVVSLSTATLSSLASADSAVQPGDLSGVATSGSYNDLSDQPSIPPAQINSDWDSTGGVAEILNKPPLGSLAAKSKVGISDIDATGMPSAQTFLNGAGAWEAPAGGADTYFQTIRSVVPTGTPAVTIADIDDDEVMLFVDEVEHDGSTGRNISISLSIDNGATFTLLGNSAANQTPNSPIFLLYGIVGLRGGNALAWGAGVPYGAIAFPSSALSQSGRAIMRSKINAIQVGLTGAGDFKNGIGAVRLLARRPAP